MTNLKTTFASNLCKLALVLIVLLSSFMFNRAKAVPPAIKIAANDTTSLKAFEGIYQQKDNEFACFKVTVVNDSLVAKQVDGDRQIKLSRKSEPGFEMPDDDGDEMIPVVFSKNDAGEISQIMVGGRQLWLKVKNYVPVKEVKLTPEQLKAFEGKYQSEDKKDAFIQITATQDSLTLKQSWDGREINFMSIGNDTFLNKQNAFPLKFTKDQDGNVIKVLAFNRDLWDKVKE